MREIDSSRTLDCSEPPLASPSVTYQAEGILLVVEGGAKAVAETAVMVVERMVSVAKVVLAVDATVEGLLEKAVVQTAVGDMVTGMVVAAMVMAEAVMVKAAGESVTGMVVAVMVMAEVAMVKAAGESVAAAVVAAAMVWAYKEMEEAVMARVMVEAREGAERARREVEVMATEVGVMARGGAERAREVEVMAREGGVMAKEAGVTEREPRSQDRAHCRGTLRHPRMCAKLVVAWCCLEYP